MSGVVERLREIEDAGQTDADMSGAWREVFAALPALLDVAEAAQRMRDSYGVSESLSAALDALDEEGKK